MIASEFKARIVEWAKHRSDVRALVLAGSRASPANQVDQWADWDFHLVSNRPDLYYKTDWPTEIAPVWCAHTELTPRGVTKVSVVFENGIEADFVPLGAWQMRLVYWAMQYPEWRNWMPVRLYHGIQETQAFLLGSGYHVLVGGEKWIGRMDATRVVWPARTMRSDEFTKHTAAFWQKTAWVSKKISRPELRSAMHWMHMVIINHVYAILAEEARLAGRVPRPEARKAEQWLDEKRLAQTTIATGLDQATLARALLAVIDLFEEVSLSVATSRGFILADYSAVAAWLRAELGKLVEPS